MIVCLVIFKMLQITVFQDIFSGTFLLFKEGRDVEKNKDSKFLSINKIAALMITGL